MRIPQGSGRSLAGGQRVRSAAPRVALLIPAWNQYGRGIIEGVWQYAQQHGLSNITFLGYLGAERLIPLVQRAAFTIFPSECYENYPSSIIESFACGTPVIGSNIGGIPDIIQDGRSGLLFEPGNPQQLADRIQFLADHPEKSVEMGQNARRQVESTNHPEYHYGQLISYYEQVLREKGQPSHRFGKGVQ